MDADTFDDLLRFFSGRPTRRGIGRILSGLALGGTAGRLSLADTEAKKKRKNKKKKKCRGGKKKCGKKCLDLQADPSHCGSCSNICEETEVCLDGTCACPVGEADCGGACCSLASCIADTCCPAEQACGTVCCDAGQICGDPATNLCVTGQGTCPGGANVCEGDVSPCNNNAQCGCFESTTNVTRCGRAVPAPVCAQCLTDADCALIFPAIPGVFCMKVGSAPCPCAPGQNQCAAPC